MMIMTVWFICQLTQIAIKVMSEQVFRSQKTWGWLENGNEFSIPHWKVKESLFIQFHFLSQLNDLNKLCFRSAFHLLI